MVSDFPRTLCLLRQEKKISQRKAAGELGVSQALLSHYENGVREPGLSFVVRAADYYGVSADFLLGRTMARDGGAILAEDLADSSVEKDNILHGSAAAMLSKKLLVNSTSLLYEQIGKENRNLVRVVSDYMNLAFYKVYRLLYTMDDSSSKKAFGISPQTYRQQVLDSHGLTMESSTCWLIHVYTKAIWPSWMVTVMALSRWTWPSRMALARRLTSSFCIRRLIGRAPYAGS